MDSTPRSNTNQVNHTNESLANASRPISAPNAEVEQDVAESSRPGVHTLDKHLVRKFDFEKLTFKEKMKVAHAHMRKISLVKACRECRKYGAGGSMLVKNASTGLHSFIVRRCNRSSICPECSHIKAREHRRRLGRILKKASKANLECLFGVFTISRRSKKTTTKRNIQVLTKAYSEFMRAAFRREIDCVGAIKITEVVYNDAYDSGHAHINVLLLIEKRSDRALELLINTLKARWIKHVRRVSSVHTPQLVGQFVQRTPIDEDGIERLAQYVSKVSKREWETVDEATFGNFKTIGGDTLLGLLLKSANGCERSADLYHDFCGAIKHHRVFIYSHKLESKLDELLAFTGEVVEEEKEDELITVAEISSQQWLYISEMGIELLLLEIMNHKKLQQEREALLTVFNAFMLDIDVYKESIILIVRAVLARRLPFITRVFKIRRLLADRPAWINRKNYKKVVH